MHCLREIDADAFHKIKAGRWAVVGQDGSYGPQESIFRTVIRTFHSGSEYWMADIGDKMREQ